jgi:bacterioferritin-associated ferredoxin
MTAEVDIDFQLHPAKLWVTRTATVGNMIVCHCRRVCDRTIRAAIQAGARTEDAVAEACGAGSVCGGCGPVVSELIDEHHDTRRLPVVCEHASSATSAA